MAKDSLIPSHAELILEPNPHTRYSIKQVANMIGVVPATIRNWEETGLFTAKRSQNNYRYFTLEDLEYLRKIAIYSQNGMSISYIKKLLSQELSAHLSQEGTNKITDSSSLPNDYHEKLRLYRERRKMTLAQVADGIGISPSYLSRIEQGKCNLTLHILEKLSDYYGERTTILLGDDMNNRIMTKSGQGAHITMNYYLTDVEALNQGISPSFNTCHLTIRPGGGDLKSHNRKSGSEVLYILEGQLLVTLDDSEEFLMHEGDTITFPSIRYHKWQNNGTQDCKALWFHSFL